MSNIRGKILTLFGVKGGIGKSILTMSLAGVASNKSLKVLIIDMDIYGGSIALALNKPVSKTIYNFFDDYTNNRYKDINDYIIKYNDNISFISSPKDPRKSNKINIECLEMLVDKVKFNYDLVLIDMSHIINELNLSILDKSDEILLVTTNDLFDIKNMKNLISVFKDLDKDNYRLLLNNGIRYDRDYFNLYDIKDIVKANIDYIISNKFYIKDIDNYLIDGNIITLDKKNINTSDYKVLSQIIDDIMGDYDE